MQNTAFYLKLISDQITICQISFEIFDVKQIDTRAKRYFNSIWVFPFFHYIFLLKWNKPEIFNKKTRERSEAVDTAWNFI